MIYVFINSEIMSANIEYRKVCNMLRYYDNLLKTNGELTPKQQSKKELLQSKYDELYPSIPHKERKYASYEEYLKANKENSKQRYQRLKEQPEFKEKLREASKKYYEAHKRKSSDDDDKE